MLLVFILKPVCMCIPRNPINQNYFHRYATALPPFKKYGETTVLPSAAKYSYTLLQVNAAGVYPEAAVYVHSTQPN